MASAAAVTAQAPDIEILVFSPWDLSEDHADAAYADLLHDIVMTRLPTEGFGLLAADSWSVYSDSTGSDDVFGILPLLAAAQESSDIAVAIYYQREDPRIFLMVKVYDVRRQRLISAETEMSRSGLTLVNSVHRLMDSVLADIDAAAADIRFMKNNPGTLTGTNAAVVDFYSTQEGLELSIPGIGRFGTITNGTARLPYQPLAMGQSLEIQKEAPGYYPQTQRFRVNGIHNEVTLAELYPRARRGLEISYNVWTALGLATAYRHYIRTDQSFIRWNYQFYLQLPSRSGPAGGGAVYHNDFSAELGQYVIFPASSPFRLAYSAGGGIIIHLGESISAADSYINLAGIHLEYNRQDWAVFLRQELRYSLPLHTHSFFPRGTGIAPSLLPTTMGVLFKWQ